MEIWNVMVGKVDIFVLVVGMGGIIMGIGCYFKSKNFGVYIVVVELVESVIFLGLL